VVPVYDQWDMTRRCLASLAEQEAGADFEVLVVDNGSTDETPGSCPAMGRGLFGEAFEYLAPGENLNFGPGCNLGAGEARGENLFFLNNDTTVTPGWAGPLMDAISGGAGAAGPLLIFPGSGSVQHLGVAFHVGLEASHLHSHIPGDHPLALKRRDLQAVTGAALMIPRDLFMRIGGFYPEYRNGCEDLELCCRVREHGRSVVCEPDSVVVHAAGQSVGRGEEEARNFALLRERCGHCFRPDFREFARRDGYILRLNEICDPYMAAPPERSRRHLDTVGDFDEAACRAILQQEIYWEEGYEALARFLESAGRLREAMYARYEQSMFFERKEHLLEFVRLARLNRDREAVSLAQRALAMIRAEEEDPDGLLAKARAGYEHYEESGDRETAELYRDRMEAVQNAVNGAD
jgi:hypothetical protein